MLFKLFDELLVLLSIQRAVKELGLVLLASVYLKVIVRYRIFFNVIHYVVNFIDPFLDLILIDLGMNVILLVFICKIVIFVIKPSILIIFMFISPHTISIRESLKDLNEELSVVLRYSVTVLGVQMLCVLIKLLLLGDEVKEIDDN